MRGKHIALLITVTSLGLLLVLISVVGDHTASTLAAPQSSDAFIGLSGESLAFSYQTQIMCTIQYTTTSDPLAGHHDFDNAASLADYNNLVLVVGNKDQTVETKEYYFQLNNTKVGSTYKVEALPNKTTNYNLGIIVYDVNRTPIITDTDTSDNAAEVTLEPTNQGPYYFKVFQASEQCFGGTYDLEYSRTSPTATPTSTPSTPTEEDDYEPNNSSNEAYELPVVTSVTLKELEGVANFYPTDDEDWFKFWTKDGFWYRATTSELNGVDTHIEIRNKNDEKVESDDDGGGGYASLAEWEAKYDNYYYIGVTNKVETTGSYNLKVEEISAPTTATPVSGPGPDPKADSCENNLDFEHACVIAVNQSQTFNFIPAYYEGVDNDYFKLWVKPGLIYDCATSGLSPGVDTNMIFYDHDQNGIGGNDDVEPGKPASALSYYATYDGWLYILVGYGDRTPSDVNNSNYTLLCEARVPGEPTATPTPEGFEPTSTPQPTATSEPGVPTATATATPPETSDATPTPTGLTVRTLTTPTPVPTPAPDTTPASRFIPISLLVYYDANDDHQPGAGEGIAGVSVQAYEVITNQLLAQSFTDEQGNLEFTVAAQGAVRVNVPYLGFSQLVTSEEASIYLRVPTR
jgi:hypothetical protein